MPTVQRELPTPAELALANYKMGTYLSDLDSMLTSVESQSELMSVEQYLTLSEVERKAFEPPQLDADQLAHIVTFAADALDDAESIRRAASKLQAEALGLYHEREQGFADEDAARRAWHRESLERLDSNEGEVDDHA